LAAISLRGEPDISRRIRTFAGDDRYILDFLVSEVLQQQPPDLQAFLLDTSVLDRFNAPLCAALTGRADAQSVLEHLEQSNLFIVPLDQVRGWYRYHHLFADLLRDQLRRTQPDRMARLQQLAQVWYAAHDPVDEVLLRDRAAPDQSGTATPAQLSEPLSDREREILRLIEQGLSNQEIAQRLFVAVSTIKWHINHLYAKLDAHSRTQAIARARELSLL
jgi:LuxR family maltose regulon positive regulatory protein